MFLENEINQLKLLVLSPFIVFVTQIGSNHQQYCSEFRSTIAVGVRSSPPTYRHNKYVIHKNKEYLKEENRSDNKHTKA